MTCGKLKDGAMLFKLSRNRCVRVDVGIDDNNLKRAKREGTRHRESWSPLATIPGEVNALDPSKIEPAQHRYTCITTIICRDRFFKVQIPLFAFRRFFWRGFCKR